MVGGSEWWRARAEAIAWAAGAAADPRTVYLDTETTGLGPDDEVVDIAVVDRDGRRLLDTLVRPARPIPPSATAIHGIRDDHVLAAPAWPEVHRALIPLLAGRRVVVYNAAFDRRLVLGCCRRHGLALDEAEWECAMLQFARYRGEPNGRSGSYRWHKLEAAARAFGAVAGGHRAAADALACRAVVVGMSLAVGEHVLELAR